MPAWRPEYRRAVGVAVLVAVGIFLTLVMLMITVTPLFHPGGGAGSDREESPSPTVSPAPVPPSSADDPAIGIEMATLAAAFISAIGGACSGIAALWVARHATRPSRHVPPPGDSWPRHPPD